MGGEYLDSLDIAYRRYLHPSTAKLKNNPYSCKGSLMTSATDPSTALTPYTAS
ncbi:hypothetical protein [Nostoc commune]|uniref:hypothetical protein n=1 Tax=Nostoc commune TaxID=1178 RepID=UPI003969EEC5